MNFCARNLGRSWLAVVAMTGLGWLAAVPAYAQIVSYQQQVFAPGVNVATGTPQWTNVYPASAVTCGQTPISVPTGPNVVNPGHIEFDDPNATGKVCLLAFASGTLAALPNGTGYLATMTQTDNLGQISPRSAASNPFDKQGVPGVLTGLRVVP